ncbi:RagB/SusD family nutrient uptake outer membrane protein [Proteiniphilum sp. UBA5384]|uniref:RagB/SusD family nutrient uptake outer membrane protein n=1 Tax=Proteiniphilum sp. UBA5384 TaxID=1947279 RepID=UPI0025CDFF3A|nr:RagB/SusD family nutrient uptake outer membrane protein [Proteiniphilum sp. UBA5384]
MKIKIYIAVFMAVALTGCNDWLDVNPRQEMKENQLFSIEDGFKSSLTGVYIQLANPSLYGRNTSIYLPDMLSRNWIFPPLTSNRLTDYALGNYNFTDSGVEALIEVIWKSYYQSIAQLNNILTALEENEINFSYDNDKLIKGEALGLRAFLHFEVLRYFGEVPSKASPGNRAIPYVTQMTKDANLLVSTTWEEVIKSIEEDLNKAEKLLGESDPILTYPNTRLNNPQSYTENIPEDEWHFYRQNRFNYYAVLGAKARFYQWIGNKSEASKYAKQVIDAVNEDETPKFRLNTDPDYSGSAPLTASLVFPSEHLFSIHNPQHQRIVEPLFKEENATLTQSMAKLREAYENSTNPSDIRFADRRYWEQKSYQHSATVVHFYKYIGNDLGNSPGNIVPIMRLSEMYFILVESLPLQEAIPYFEKYRIARGLENYMTGELTNEVAVKSRLEKEYRKEFFGEGQMFFFYKRFNYTSVSWPDAYMFPANPYKLPIPKSQSVFE